MPDAVRIDKWLWAVRLFKTRTQAADACRAGHTRVNGEVVKASRDIRVGDLIVVRSQGITRTVRVRAVVESRLGAGLVPDYLEDLTPPEELAKPRERQLKTVAWRAPGAGRPTKRERRQLDQWLDGSGA